ncbi:hypothetical protein VTN31DRAFT_549 [Thermomyces dupontii]|uniref:uncharacterized protein n=1 Tax=Talaromyces thermophilus TaxID=28565 RepID=UPI00374283DE
MQQKQIPSQRDHPSNEQLLATVSTETGGPRPAAHVVAYCLICPRCAAYVRAPQSLPSPICTQCDPAHRL